MRRKRRNIFALQIIIQYSILNRINRIPWWWWWLLWRVGGRRRDRVKEADAFVFLPFWHFVERFFMWTLTFHRAQETTDRVQIAFGFRVHFMSEIYLLWMHGTAETLETIFWIAWISFLPLFSDTNDSCYKMKNFHSFTRLSEIHSMLQMESINYSKYVCNL